MGERVSVDLQHVKVVFGRRKALNGVSLDIRAGEKVAIVGESGAGKSTLLNVIAGLVEMSEGSLKIGGKDAKKLAPCDRGVGMVFQSDALFPHMSVYENIAFPLRARHDSRQHVKSRVDELLTQIGLKDRANDLPGNLSGGQRQRVGLARALASAPSVLLLDEPFASLDTTLRRQLRHDLLHLHGKLGFTLISVTHDPSESAQIGDRIAVLREGILAAFECGSSLYWNPTNTYLAGLFGEYNLIPIDFEDGTGTPIVFGRRLPIALAAQINSNFANLLVRPESVRVSFPDECIAECDTSWEGKVLSIRDLGKVWGLEIHISESGKVIQSQVVASGNIRTFAAGDSVICSIDWGRSSVLDGQEHRTSN